MMARRPGLPVRSSERSSLDVWLAFAFGVIFVSVMLYLATVEKNPTPLAIRVYVTVLALAAGGVGAILPGFFEIQYKGFIRAGGALGMTALIYLNGPTIGKDVASFVEPKTAAEPVAQSFLQAIDSGDPSHSWALLPETARSHVGGSETAWNELYHNVVVPLGHPESRTLIGESRDQSPSGAPPGLYHVYTYKTKYSNDAAPRLESVVLRANSDDAWEIYAYQIGSETISG